MEHYYYFVRLKSPPFVKGDLGRFYERSIVWGTLQIPPNPPLQRGGQIMGARFILSQLERLLVCLLPVCPDICRTGTDDDSRANTVSCNSETVSPAVVLLDTRLQQQSDMSEALW